MTMPLLPAPAVPRCFGAFELVLARAISEQLAEFLAGLVPAPLSNVAALGMLPDTGGVYQLSHGGHPVYVGKADSLRARLRQHASDFDGRIGISRADVSFVCATLSENWSPFGAEDILMARAAYGWQNSGFGNNDPGRNRDQSQVPADHWDRRYPINLQWPCTTIGPGLHSAADLLVELKAQLPFLLRFERSQKGGPPPAAVRAAHVHIPQAGMPFWDIMALIVQALPGWQATALPGYAIFYNEHPAPYPAALATLP